ncbi:MAG: hypothetical protein IJE65_04390 [Clostridia bacterium]|nr:hypothetical protein [Clostridia bacterium]
MYSKFDFKLTNSFYNTELNKYLEFGKKEYDNHKAKVKQDLKKFIYDNGKINGSSLKEHWFNIVDADIFISHSHQDINKVKAFAGWLKHNFNLTCFIDSCVWGYCDELLKQIDDEKCKNANSSTYSYELRNYTTSHVHMMLSIALSEMINNSECVIFFNTPESVSLTADLESLKENKHSTTLSPWIYHELAMTSLIRPIQPKRETIILEHSDRRTLFAAEQNTIHISHDVDKYISEMIKLTDEDLKKWKRTYGVLTHQLDGDNIPFIKGYEDINALDVLYSIKGIV